MTARHVLFFFSIGNFTSVLLKNEWGVGGSDSKALGRVELAVIFIYSFNNHRMGCIAFAFLLFIWNLPIHYLEEVGGRGLSNGAL